MIACYHPFMPLTQPVVSSLPTPRGLQRGVGESFSAPLNFKAMRLLCIPVACPQALYQNSWNVGKRIQCNMLLFPLTLTILLSLSLVVNPYTSSAVRGFICFSHPTGHLLIIWTLQVTITVNLMYLSLSGGLPITSPVSHLLSVFFHYLSHSSLSPLLWLKCLCVLTFD